MNNQINLAPQSNFAGLEQVTVPKIISSGLTLTLIVAGVVFFFMLVIGGIKWILSGGDKGQTEAARNNITAALIGLVVVFSAWAFANLIQTFFGISIFSFTIPSFR